MHGKHRKKAPKLLVFRAVAVLVLAVVFSVSSFATVMANTVSASVIDGDKAYTFSMDSADKASILAQAEEYGLAPLGPLDVAEQVDNTTTINIRRGISMAVNEAGKRTNLVAYQGDTVAETLEHHNILIKDEDQITPSRDTVISAGLSVEIRRYCQVTVTADGSARQISLTGGTVADALEKADVVLNSRDSANYELTEPLFDKMNIRVSRTVKLKITADGKTGEYEVSAGTVRAALKKCGVELSEDDRLSVDGDAKPENGMHVIVTRVETEEVTETEEIDYPVEYVVSDSMYEDETEICTPGEKGQKEITYKLIYVAGELEDKEIVSEEVVKEPVTEIVAKGSKTREEQQEPSFNSGDGGMGTITDTSGNTLSYSKMLVGTCTAYCPASAGPITATGTPANYGCIAVNPNIIPYGTRLYITSPDGSIVYGYGTAVDTGGAAMAGDIIADLCYDTEAECTSFGRREMVLYVLS